MSSGMNTAAIFQMIAGLIVVLTAMPVHEYSHAFMADRLGDPTPREQKRLTLNPLRHLDPLGSLLIMFMGFGWARPVEVDARNFRHPRRDMALVAIAGPLSNIAAAFVANVIYTVLLHILDPRSTTTVMIITILYFIMRINLYLAVFNLLPIPPLDGSKFFGAMLPDRFYFTMMRYERMISFLLIILLFTGTLSPYLQRMAGGLEAMLDFLVLPIDLFFYTR